MAMGQISPEVVTGTYVTTNATEHTVVMVNVPEKSVILAEAIVLGKDVNNKAVVAKRYTTGTKVGAVDFLETIMDKVTGNAVVRLLTENNQLKVKVTGPKTPIRVEWQVELKVYIN